MKKITLLIAFFATIIVACIIFSRFQVTSTNAQDEITVGIMSGYEPYARMNARGEFEGFDVDVAKEIAQKLNKKLVFKDMNIAPLIIALDQGSIDLLLSALSITQERKERMGMVYYQGEPVKAFTLLFWKEIPAGIKSISDLRTLSSPVVCTEAGTKKEQYLQSLGFLTVKSMGGMSDIILDLKYGKSIAAFLEPEVVPALKRQNPELITMDVPMPEAYQSEGFGIGINKRNVQLLKQVEDIVAQLRADGTLARLEACWFVEGN